MENQKKDSLEELDEIVMKELRYYSETEGVINEARQHKTDRMVKLINTKLGLENLRERKFMNRTERRESIRKANNATTSVNNE